MGWLGRKRKLREETVDELPHEPLEPLRPVLNLLIPDVAGATSFHLRQFRSAEEARAYIETLPSTSGLHAFWGLHEPPAGHVSGEGASEAMVLIRSAEESDTVYVVSFVDLDSANAFARFEAKRGMSPGLLLIYWAELVNIEAVESGVRLSPETPPHPASRFAGVQAATSTGTSESAPAPPSPALQTHAATAEPEPVVRAEPKPRTPQPAPVVEAEPEVVAPLAEPLAEAEPETAVRERQPVELEVPTPEHEPVAEAEVAVPEPETVAEPEPETVAPVAEPVAETPVEVATPEPEPVVETEPEVGTPEPRRVFEVSLRKPTPAPEPVTEEPVIREPEPVAHREAEPVAEASSSLFHADVHGSSDEELDIEREAIAFLKASARATKAPAPEAGRRPPPPEAVAAEPVETVIEEPLVPGNWASTETIAPATKGFAGVAGPARAWDSRPEEESAVEGENSDERVEEVAKILKVKRWDKKDSPFRGFDSPPGRF